MKYTQEQYENMRSDLDSSVLNAEIHTGRIRARLENVDEEQHLIGLYTSLQSTLQHAVRLMREIENASLEGVKYHA